ncbi:DEAD-box ATP-dependent RNA helicase 31-like [Iris pallida]|uniref:ATP-dependent RNA helicase n=1 Tax=Iris pallida TaxID=29817 RepID=A0AAX6HGN1_IRIPA|nr:DEAD-box ATP-dependent RNA helicase 31-like [Iris pallida]
MVGQLLRLLASSRSLLSSRASSSFNLKTLNFSSRPSFSGRQARSRDHVRPGFRPERSSASGLGAGHGKSLIEDEAELSDWVSDLKTDSIRLGLSSDDDDSGRGRRKISSGKDSDRGSVRARDTGGFSDRRSSRSSAGFPERSPRGSFVKKRFDSDLDDEDEEEEKKRFLSSKKKNVSGSDGLRRMERTPRGYGSDLEAEKERRSSSALKKREGKGANAESSYRQGRARKSLAIDVSEEDEDEDEEEDEDDDDDDDDDDDVMAGFENDYFGDKMDGKKATVNDTFKSATSGFSDSDAEAAESGEKLSRSPGDKNSYLSEMRFDQCTISPLTLKGIKAVGYERMTLVQEATLPVILKGKDVLAKARTGTGKTVAFLLPAIEIVSKLPPVDRDQKRPPINVLVICPTRELADQAATEASTLLKFHPSIGVQVVIGGTRLALEQKRMQANPCQILVATPGRLKDHIENTPGFATRLMGVKVLVLDEADRLLDMGFRKDIEKIVAAVPKQRQTLLFSATVPDDVRQICYIAMKRDHEFVNTVEEGSEETHSQVRQMHLVVPLEKQFSMLYGLLTEHIAEDVDYKVIVFCTTAMMTKLVADLLSELRLNVREIHSRKPQSYRTRVSKEFKESKGLILVSSDVSARGVDYPDVTLVVQVGVPADREQYIHRLGRTGRKGKEGKGILILAPWEEFFLSSIKDLPITDAQKPLVDPDTIKKVERALGHVEMRSKESAYQAWLGYYNSIKNVGHDKYKLVLLANEFSRSMGLDNPPAIAKLVLRKMGLNNVPGLRAK